MLQRVLTASLLALLPACASTSSSPEGKPDLVVEEVEVLEVAREGYASVIDLRVTVRNVGDRRLPVSRVHLAAEVQNADFEPHGSTVEASYRVGEATGGLLFEAEGRLAPGERATTRARLFVRTPWPGRMHRVVVLVDAGFGLERGAILESNEENNEGSTLVELR